MVKLLIDQEVKKKKAKTGSLIMLSGDGNTNTGKQDC